jgi:transcriptional regulator with XRE-family HTH domain
VSGSEAPVAMLPSMDDQQLGAAFRLLRIKRRWRQEDLAAKAGLSRWAVHRIERGHADEAALRTLRALAAALDARLLLRLLWEGAELDRLINARHGQLEQLVTTWLVDAGWEVAPEVSFNFYGERGIVDLVAWHPPTRSLLLIEIKTEIVEIHQIIASADVRKRLAMKIVEPRGWSPRTVSIWVAVAEGRTNRRRLEAHRAVLRGAFPHDGRQLRAWLPKPDGALAALSFLPDAGGTHLRSRFASTKRVRRPRSEMPILPNPG